MTTEDHRAFAADLLELVQQMELILKDYSRLLSAHDDGHELEKGKNEEHA